LGEVKKKGKGEKRGLPNGAHMPESFTIRQIIVKYPYLLKPATMAVISWATTVIRNYSQILELII
jgi:hypothetical protein